MSGIYQLATCCYGDANLNLVNLAIGSPTLLYHLVVWYPLI